MSGGKNKAFTTLREYLNCEYEHKLKKKSNFIFDAKSMPGNEVKVPGQTNTSDCGLFMLQYIEQFFKVCFDDLTLDENAFVCQQYHRRVSV